MSRGGARAGAGRPKKNHKTVIYSKTIKPEWKHTLDLLLMQLRNDTPIAKKVKNILGLEIDVL